MTTDTRVNLFQAVKAHNLDLESARGITSGADLEALDVRLQDARRLLEWLAQAPAPHHAAFPVAQTPPPSSFPADPNRISPLASDPPKTRQRSSP
jgi:hypothetical protein